MSRSGGAVEMRGGGAIRGEPTGGRLGGKPGYTRAELIKDLRCSRARDLGLDATAAHVREKLMVFANAERQTFVSVATLAAAVGRSEKTVRRALSRLYEAGEVTPRIEVTAWGRRNVYTLAGPRAVAAGEAPAVASAVDGGEAGPPGCNPAGQRCPRGSRSARGGGANRRHPT